MFASSGILRYSRVNYHRLIVEIDPELVRYYRSFLDIRTNPQRYDPHISVVRHHEPQIFVSWGIFEGMEVHFEYSPIIHNSVNYYWLDVYSAELCMIRVGLGLSPGTGLFGDCFHITLANRKGLA